MISTNNINMDRLRVAVSVACGVVKPCDADHVELGFGWSRPDDDDVRRECAATIMYVLESILEGKQDRNDD
jgi:hypothetical protein